MAISSDARLELKVFRANIITILRDRRRELSRSLSVMCFCILDLPRAILPLEVFLSGLVAGQKS